MVSARSRTGGPLGPDSVRLGCIAFGRFDFRRILGRLGVATIAAFTPALLPSCADDHDLSCGVDACRAEWFVSETQALADQLGVDPVTRCADYGGYISVSIGGVSRESLSQVSFDGVPLNEVEGCQISNGYGTMLTISETSDGSVWILIDIQSARIQRCPRHLSSSAWSSV